MQLCFSIADRHFFLVGPDSFLRMNVLNMPFKSQVRTVNNKRDILDQKIKVKKSVLNFPFLQLLSNYHFIHMIG